MPLYLNSCIAVLIKICPLRILVKITLFLYSSLLFSQTQDSIRIVGHLEGNSKYSKVVLIGFEVGQKTLGAAKIIKDTFSFNVPFTILPGVYRFQFSQVHVNEYLDVIIDGVEQKIQFTIDLNNNTKLPFFIESNENKRWYDYLAQSQIKLRKIELLDQMLDQYPDQNDKIIGKIKQSVKIEKEKYSIDFEKFCSLNTRSLATEMVANRPFYFTNASDLPQIQNYNRRNHFWDHINTSNPKLINTPIYSEHILNYLNYYRNPEMKFDVTEMENGFMKSVATIVQKFGGNKETKDFALQYLTLGFKEIGQEKVLQYMDEKYSTDWKECQNETSKKDFDQRIAGYAKMKVGIQAPDIEYNDVQGYAKKLKDIEGETIIVAFWASWCPSCSDEMPKLNELIATNKTVKVLAISLDEDKKRYSEAILNLNNMIHYSDFKKWNEKSVIDYNVVATPSFFVLDKDKKIIGKYNSLAELKSAKRL